MKKKKKTDWLFVLLLLTISLVIYLYRDEIMEFSLNVIYPKNVELQEINEYKIDYEFGLVKNTDKFIINDRTEFINAFYTILNNGWNDFTFYCDNEYKNCQEDINDFINEDSLLASINNFVSPFNEYDTVSVTVNSLGKINVVFVNNYSEEEIKLINTKLDEIMAKIIKEDMTDEEKIKALHDYIINNSKYDSDTELYKKATGLLLYGYGNCSAYTDTMSLLLNRLKIPNYRIASEDHTWNLVLIDGYWKHMDLTWDDPVIINVKKDVLTHDYFLINTEKLLKLDKEKHNFDENIYIEAKKEEK